MHNHPSRCCCTPHPSGGCYPATICPACPEHGEDFACTNNYPHNPHGNCPGDHDPE